MHINIRDTAAEDLDAILRIGNDALVAPHQYRQSLAGTRDKWCDFLAGKRDTKFVTFRCATILDGDTIIGNVSQWHINSNDRPIVQCGWNLTPAYWGRGVMCLALTELFNRFFANDGVAHIYADCFRSNHRCIRVLEKLGFTPNGIPPHHRVIIAWSMRCLHWIRRFRLDSEMWQPSAP
ncbi:GNAT family N-acetyltransferase [Lignipirellula cremea]|nr:GNAT family N-acetyltransferase [Lignipirellula cremea]